MAEEAPVVQNWKLLTVSAVLGVVVAVLHNVHMQQIRKAERGDMVTVLQVTKDLQPGEPIKGEYLLKKPVPKSVADNMGNPMFAEAYDWAITQNVNSMVRKDSFLTYANVTKETDKARPLNTLSAGMVAVTVPVDPRLAPQQLLRLNDHVDIMGVFTIDKTSNFMIIEGVRVIEIGGHVAKDSSARSPGDEGWSSFRSISIEVGPNVGIQLRNVLSHATSVSLQGRNPNDEFPANPQISPQVKKLADSAAGGAPVAN